MGHYFFSYILTWEVYLIEILEIMPQMWQYIDLNKNSVQTGCVYTVQYEYICTVNVHNYAEKKKCFLSKI